MRALPDLARRGNRNLTLHPEAEALAELGTAATLGAHLLSIGAPDYHALLAGTETASPVLYARGDLALVRGARDRELIALSLRWQERIRDIVAELLNRALEMPAAYTVCANPEMGNIK